MKRSILFITETSTFLNKTLMAKMEEQAFDCYCCEYDIDKIDSLKDAVTSVLLFVEEDTMFKFSKTFIYLKDMCLTDDIKVYVLGDTNDAEKVASLFNTKVMWKVFPRPVNVVNVCDQIVLMYNGDSEALGKKKILMVDDSGTFLHTMQEWLSDKYDIDVVNSAITAIAYLAHNIPDLILLDYEMPVCDGPTMLEMIRTDSKAAKVPVMFLTGKGDRESIEKVLALHPQGYLLKSMPKEVLLDKLNAFFVQMGESKK